jgi:hypothetical protein
MMLRIMRMSKGMSIPPLFAELYKRRESAERRFPGVIMIIGWRKQSLLRLFSLPNDTFGSE